MKKKFLVALTAMAMASFFAGCGDSGSTDVSEYINSSDSKELSSADNEMLEDEETQSEENGSKEDSESDDENSDDDNDESEGSDEKSSSSKKSSSSTAKSSSSSEASSSSQPSSDSEDIDSSESQSSTSEESSEWQDYCLEVVNKYRATEDLPPLARAKDKESCVTEQAAKDMAMNVGHGNFGDCGEGAQNSGPNVNPKYYSTEEKIVDVYVSMMWEDEKAKVTSGERDPEKSEDYPYIGHYLNMKNTKYKSLACGIAYNEDGSMAWFNMDFFTK